MNATEQTATVLQLQAAIGPLAQELAGIRGVIARAGQNAPSAELSELRAAIETVWRDALRGLKPAVVETVIGVAVAPGTPEDYERLVNWDHERTETEDGCQVEDAPDDAAGSAPEDDGSAPERERGKTGRGKRAGRRHRRQAAQVS